jgi:hypothetical protein
MVELLGAGLRAVGIRRPADVVPVAIELARDVGAALSPDDPSMPLSHAAVDQIEAQRDSATAHKVPQPPPRKAPKPKGKP